MKDEFGRQDDLPDWDEGEARGLAEIVDRLKSDQFVPADAHFWTTLNQRIIEEIQQTPLPSKEREKPKQPRPSLLDWISRRWAELGRGRLVLLGATAVLLVLVGVWLVAGLERTRPSKPSLELAAGEEASQSSHEEISAMRIPEELWSKGFLTHREILWDSSDLQDWLALDDNGDFSPTFDDPFDSLAPWSLDDFSQQDLLYLEQLLGG